MRPIRLVVASVLAGAGWCAWAWAQPGSLPPLPPVPRPAALPPAAPLAGPPPATGTITADLVNVRCGPNLYYYPLTTVSQGVKVTIRGEPGRGWVAIDPPEGVIGLVRRAEVMLSEDGSTASVTVPSARVYATGPRADRQWCVMATLPEGEKVKVLGPGPGDLVRVAPPDSARAYITKEYVKVEVAALPPPPPPPPVEVQGPPEPPPEIKIEAPATAVDSIIQEQKDAEAAVAEELKKPLAERQYDPLIARFTDVAEKAAEDWLKRRAQDYADYLKVLAEHRKGYLAAQEVDARLREDLAAIREDRTASDADAADRAAERARFDAVGTVGRLKFADPAAQSPINHKLVDAQGRTLYVLRSTRHNLDGFVGKTVGVRGPTSHVPDWNAMLITVEAIEEVP